jgi:release factor glutamine methyltransferase
MTKNNSGKKTTGGTLEKLILRLGSHSDTPGLDAQVLLARLLNEPSSRILAHPERMISTQKLQTLEKMVGRLEKGEPLPYILTRWEFFGLEFDVTPDVLIPRPETELMVERAIAWLQRHPEKRIAADIGTGSGCIAIALAVNIPDLQVVATDISPAALRVARRNAVKHHLQKRIEFLKTDLFPPVDPERTFSLVAANLPYIPTKTLHSLPVYGREPTIALDGGVDGLTFIRRFLSLAPKYMEKDGLLLLEIEATEGAEVLSLAYDTFMEGKIHLHKDLADHERLLEVQVGDSAEMEE